MLSIFPSYYNKKESSDDEEKKEESSESSDDEYSSDDEEGNYFLRHMIYEDGYKKLFKTDARDFVPEIKLWAQQRPINKKHIEKLEKEVKLNKHFKGNMKLLLDKNNNCRLIDGQHRYYALKNIMEKDSKFNINIILEVYETDNIESDNSIKIFKDVNNCLNIKISDLPNIKASSVLNSLCLEFPDMFVDVKAGCKKVNRPRINKKILYEKIKEYFVDTKYNDKNLLDQILEKNRAYGLRGRTSFGVSDKMYETCKKSGFYLGLDKYFNWINYLDLGDK